MPPHCKIYGEKAGENWSRTGSCIEVRIDDPHAYAVQVQQFGKDGKLLVNHAGQPDEPNRGIATNGEGIEIRDLTFIGDFKCKGISLNSWYCGSVENVTVWNFIVGLRTMNSWCSSIEDVHITASWRGLILNGVNIIDLRNVYLSHEGKFTPDDPLTDIATALDQANIPGAIVHVHLKRGESYALRSQVHMATSKIVIDTWGNGTTPNVVLDVELGGPAVDLVHPGEATISCSDVAFHLPSPGGLNGTAVVSRSVGGPLHSLFADCKFLVGEKNGILSHAGKAATYRIMFSNCSIDGHNQSYGALSAAHDDRSRGRHRLVEHAFETSIHPRIGPYAEDNAEIVHSDLLGIVSLPRNLPTQPPVASGRLWMDPDQGYVLKMTPH